jgi:hypothetical protein
MRTMRTTDAYLVLTGILVVPLFAGAPAKKTWTFDDDQAGLIATGFTNEVGEWRVASTPDGKVLAQTAKSPNPVFNVTLISDTNAKDVDLSVRMKAIAGKNDQGGGLVWRAKDAKNYYVARNNPLGAGSYNVYKVVDGKRSMFKGVPLRRTDGWHTLRVVMTGDHIECYHDGKKYLDVHDSTFPEAGKIGLWSKSDAQSQFDDLMLITP